MIIDAHLHLWDRQCGRVDEKPVFALCEGKSNFGGEIRQMMPPYMLDGRNTAEMLIANMNYARVRNILTEIRIVICWNVKRNIRKE